MELTEIVTRLDERIGNLRDEIESLNSARRALTDGAQAATAPPQSPPRSRSTGRGSRSTRRTRQDPVPAEKIERVLAGAGALSTAEIVAQTGGDRGQVLAVLRELEQANRVRRSGERRGTRWHAFTEDDWVARRAADLAARGAQGAES